MGFVPTLVDSGKVPADDGCHYRLARTHGGSEPHVRHSGKDDIVQCDFRGLRVQLMVHAAGGLLVLLAVTGLSLFKPWGMTTYGRRQVSQADLPSRPRGDATLAREPVIATATPRWLRVVGIHAIGLVLLFVILHLTGVHGGDLGGH